MADIYLNTIELDEVVAGLDSAIAEFDSATSVSKNIQGAVARPDGRGSLRSRVGDFENDWNNTRDELKERLENIRLRLQDIIDGWRNWDAEAAAEIQSNGADNDPALHREQ